MSRLTPKDKVLCEVVMKEILVELKPLKTVDMKAALLCSLIVAVLDADEPEAGEFARQSLETFLELLDELYKVTREIRSILETKERPQPEHEYVVRGRNRCCEYRYPDGTYCGKNKGEHPAQPLLCSKCGHPAHKKNRCKQRVCDRAGDMDDCSCQHG